MARSSTHDLLDRQLQITYGAELQLLATMPRLINKVRGYRMVNALAEHRMTTKAHAVRLENCFSLLRSEARYELCEEMGKLTTEMIASLGSDPDPQQEVDLAIDLQLATQLELSLHANARIHAQEAGMQFVIRILERTLSEKRSSEALWRDIAMKETTSVQHSAWQQHAPLTGQP